jgi:hypothetical protein
MEGGFREPPELTRRRHQTSFAVLNLPTQPANGKDDEDKKRGGGGGRGDQAEAGGRRADGKRMNEGRTHAGCSFDLTCLAMDLDDGLNNKTMHEVICQTCRPTAVRTS